MQRQIALTVLSRTASTAINFLIAVIIARHAGPAVKGDVTLLVTITYFFIFFSNILGGQALVYLIPRNKMELLIVPAYLWTVIVALVGFVVLRYTQLVQVNHLISITLLSLLSSVMNIHQTILLAKNKIFFSNLITVVALLLQLVGISICFYAINIHNAYAYIYASLAAYLIATLFSFRLIKEQVVFTNFIKDYTWNEFKESFKYGFLFQITEVLQLLNLRYYFFQLGIQQGAQYLGVYSVGISILEAVWIIPRSISSIQYVSTSNSNQLKAETEKTIRLFKLSFILSALVLVIIFAVPASVYTFVFGEGFGKLRHSTRFLYPGILIYNFVLVVSSYYLGIGRYKQLIIANLAGFLSMVVFSYFLLPPYVISGAGLAATASFTVAASVLFLLFIKDKNVSLSKFKLDREDWLILKKTFRFLG
ncbi:MAG: polysaccharide biosynthesis C-terminal domain-containing protein [Chitinophagales bacterium]